MALAAELKKVSINSDKQEQIMRRPDAVISQKQSNKKFFYPGLYPYENPAKAIEAYRYYKNVDADAVNASQKLNIFSGLSSSSAIMPSVIARSALFGCKRRGWRTRYCPKTKIASRKYTEIYTEIGCLGGEHEQFDVADSDVYMQAIRTVCCDCDNDLGTDVEILPYGFLREMGRARGGETNKKWLDRSLKRLANCVVTIKVEGKYTVTLRLIDAYYRDKNSGKYYIRISKEITKLFTNNEFAVIDLEIRKKLKLPLSKWLQTYAASNKKGEKQKIGFEKLKSWCGKGNQRTDHFVTSLQKAVNELIKHGVIYNVEINKKRQIFTYYTHKK